jgi:hypothetical protein
VNAIEHLGLTMLAIEQIVAIGLFTTLVICAVVGELRDNFKKRRSP